MKLVSLEKASPPHKYVATFSTGKKTSFGDSSYQDYTQHHSKERREQYRARHRKDLYTNDPTRAGFLSYYILWGDSTSVEENLRTFKSKFNL